MPAPAAASFNFGVGGETLEAKGEDDGYDSDAEIIGAQICDVHIGNAGLSAENALTLWQRLHCSRWKVAANSHDRQVFRSSRKYAASLLFPHVAQTQASRREFEVSRMLCAIVQASHLRQ